MMLTLPIYAEQSSLPGLPPVAVDWTDPAPAEEPALPLGLTALVNQLCFGAEQQVLTPQPQAARQLALLPDPPLWEMSEPARPKPRRRPRRARAGALSPGQLPLF